ncbi:MAG TPA: cyclic nucleotide-binding domain-containing protein, partial [Clostridia bacterium]|nr:cyclic nucleotide-binding domain-containing protein [Clostridia bacterium]
MSISPSQEGNFSIKQNEIIFFEGQNTSSVNMLIQGKIEVYLTPFDTTDGMDETTVLQNSYRLFNIGKNIFTGANELFQSEKYSFSLKALEDCTIHTFMSNNQEQAKRLMHGHKDMGAYIICSISNLIQSSQTALIKLDRHIRDIGILTDNLVMFYWTQKEDIGFQSTPGSSFFRDGLDNLQRFRDKGCKLPLDFDAEFICRDHSEIIEQDYVSSDVNTARIKYYKHLSELPVDLLKAFFGSDEYISEYHIKASSDVLNELQSSLKDALKLLDTSFNKLYSENEECIFSEFIKAAKETKSDAEFSTMMQSIEFISDKIKQYYSIYLTDYEHNTGILIEQIDAICNHLKTSGITAGSTAQVNNELVFLPEELKDSAEKILAYSGLTKEKTDFFKQNLYAFRRLKNKVSSDGDARSIKSNISSVFFEVYEAVFKRAAAENNNSVLFNMFLRYSFMDEKLLSPENTLALYKLAGQSIHSRDSVYDIKEWLTRIHIMEKDPSLNDFGMDYLDVFRDMNKRRDTSSKEKNDYINNKDARLNFEIVNMFKANQKICHGQLSSYFPVLYDEMITRDISKAVVSADAVKECLNRILEIDYSAFHREINYRIPEKNIEKEYIMKRIVPDIILIPTFGSRSVMWQELSGRNRNTPGRILFPIFTAENLYDMMVKMVGNLRWELCRTVMGIAWNDIKEKSLTSEYTDYIQFYKKNRDLTEEAKDKIKSQIQKNNSRMRDIFTQDYEVWINHESKGAIRLNKVVRSILYRYCPFSKPIREQLEKSPIFSDLSIPFKNQR